MESTNTECFNIMVGIILTAIPPPPRNICIQWRSQDLILGGVIKKITLRGSEATEPERAERARGGGGCCPPSHSESSLHFDVVNGAIWCMFWHVLST